MLKPSPTYRGNLETVMTQLDHVIGFVGELHRVLWQRERREGNELGEFGR
jgi:hypothetical protein